MSSWFDRFVFLVICIAVSAAAMLAGWISFIDPVQQSSPTRNGVTALGVPLEWQLNFSHPFSPLQSKLYGLHNFLLGIDLFICGLVTVLIIYICWRFRASKNPVPYRTTHNTPLEVTWTVIPAVLLMFIAIRSFPILLEYDTIPDADITVKVTGRQWYWDYAYPDNGGLQFSSNIVPSDALPADQRALRLLAVDNEVVLPTNTNIRIQITAGDVVHSWAVPALGVKRDAIPGRLNEVWTRIEREGIYYGQCSELCGRNHALMPIAVRAVSRERFDQWLAEAKQKFALVTNLRDPQ